ncbi:MAG: leader peptidase (prepilin peptidase) / N-methyltransferase [Microbacteriaceae bacterium]|nr:leader peptidase (prepilin peptidase) / N-methyltransferase [Microbacteriaceae bacterium]
MSAVQPLRRLPLRVPARAEQVAAALLLVLGALVAVGPRPLALGLVWLAVVTPRLIAVDVAEHRLPDAVVLPGYPVVLAAVALDGASSGSGVLPALGSAGAYGGLLLLLHVAGGMGFGDVKLAPLLGLLAGALGSGAALAAPVLAFLAGGAVASAALLRTGPRGSVPFGPSMLLGAWAAVLLGA